MGAPGSQRSPVCDSTTLSLASLPSVELIRRQHRYLSERCASAIGGCVEKLSQEFINPRGLYGEPCPQSHKTPIFLLRRITSELDVLPIGTTLLCPVILLSHSLPTHKLLWHMNEERRI